VFEFEPFVILDDYEKAVEKAESLNKGRTTKKPKKYQVEKIDLKTEIIKNIKEIKNEKINNNVDSFDDSIIRKLANIKETSGNILIFLNRPIAYYVTR
jgi:hypothetical protein